MNIFKTKELLLELVDKITTIIKWNVANLGE